MQPPTWCAMPPRGVKRPAAPLIQPAQKSRRDSEKRKEVEVPISNSAQQAEVGEALEQVSWELKILEKLETCMRVGPASFPAGRIIRNRLFQPPANFHRPEAQKDAAL